MSQRGSGTWVVEANTDTEIQLTATDSKGLSATVTRNLYPAKVSITLATDPPGLRLGVNGTTVTVELRLARRRGARGCARACRSWDS